VGVRWGAAVLAVAAAAGAAWMSQRKHEEAPVTAEGEGTAEEDERARVVQERMETLRTAVMEEEGSAAMRVEGQRREERARTGGARVESDEDVDVRLGENKHAAASAAARDMVEDMEARERARGEEEVEEGGMVVSEEGVVQLPKASLFARFSSFASSAASLVSEQASQSFKFTYAIAITQRFEGERAPKKRGAAQALAAGRGNFAGFQPGPNFNANILREESLSVSELKIDAICSRLVHDVYEDDHTRWPLGGFEIRAHSDKGGSGITPKWVVLTHKAMNIVAVTFRGTFSVQDAFADLVYIPRALPCGIKVHTGMHTTMGACQEKIRAELCHAIADMVKPRLILTGHSYGGGCAKLLRLHASIDPDWLEITSRVSGIEAVTFGAPLVFGQGSSSPQQQQQKEQKPASQAAGGGAKSGAGGAGAGGQSLSALNELHRSCRCYVHQGDVVPRLLGPQSADLYETLLGSRLQEAQRIKVRSHVSAYAPIGSYRFIYTSSPSNIHHIRVAADAAEAQHLLEPLKTVFIPLAIQDHGTLLYSEKVDAVLAALLTPQS